MSNILTDEQIKAKAAEQAAIFSTIDAKVAELEASEGTQVTPLVYLIPAKEAGQSDEYIIGYLKKPNIVAQMKVTDAAYSSPTSAGELALRSGLIAEASDSRILNDAKNPAYDHIFIGACLDALSIIKRATNQYKKK